MPKILENKQLIHVASEILVLVCMVIYNNQKHKKLLKHIEDLVQRVEDQEDIIQKHEEVIKKLVLYVNNQQQITASNTQKQVQKPVRASANNKSSTRSVPDAKIKSTPHRAPPLCAPPPIPKPDTKVHFNQEFIEEESEESDTDLDQEIKEELAELQSGDEKEINLLDHVN
mgnify:CR=1 FL=1